MIPDSRMATISSVVATGLRMKRREGFIDRDPASAARLLDALLFTPRLRGRLFFVGHALTLCLRGGLFVVVHVAPPFPLAAAVGRGRLGALFPGAGLAALFPGAPVAALFG